MNLDFSKLADVGIVHLANLPAKSNTFTCLKIHQSRISVKEPSALIENHVLTSLLNCIDNRGAETLANFLVNKKNYTLKVSHLDAMISAKKESKRSDNLLANLFTWKQ